MENLHPQSVDTKVLKDERPKPQSKFLTELYAMVEQKRFPSIIEWSSDGTYFIVTDVERFSRTILPTVYNQKQMSSFIRQLNLYEFKRIKSPPGTIAYRNPYFTRGSTEWMKKIRRKPSQSKDCQEQFKTITSGLSSAPKELLDLQTKKIKSSIDEQEHQRSDISPVVQENTPVEGVNISCSTHSPASEKANLINLIRYYLQDEEERPKNTINELESMYCHHPCRSDSTSLDTIFFNYLQLYQNHYETMRKCPDFMMFKQNICEELFPESQEYLKSELTGDFQESPFINQQ